MGKIRKWCKSCHVTCVTSVMTPAVTLRLRLSYRHRSGCCWWWEQSDVFRVLFKHCCHWKLQLLLFHSSLWKHLKSFQMITYSVDSTTVGADQIFSGAEDVNRDSILGEYQNVFQFHTASSFAKRTVETTHLRFCLFFSEPIIIDLGGAQPGI